MKPVKEHFHTFMESRIRRELQRIIPLLAVMGLILIPDSSLPIMIFVIGASVMVAGMSHLLRKILFPYLNLESLIRKAEENSIAAAIIFCAIIYMLGKYIEFAATLLK